ncbi:Ioc4p SCDLUD_004137 [Saccharomycodes ludwigii]|uniref:Ioc4p n=1 Tax=Saccharomycodes ludwigii TaxID=36035 RepID=UPI001E890CF1|nr:hypothetical protein SCDLUD_004137 [Saccharomycodes ludwigii]KAH3899840.1 hypothetical protein SCDLUD_004137 [Saccharomycodes ludwigii]
MSLKPGQSILVKVKGYPAWPGMIIPHELVPEKIKATYTNQQSDIKHTGRSTRSTINNSNMICVKFYCDDNYTWINPKNKSAVDTWQLLNTEDIINDMLAKEENKRRSNKKLCDAYKVALFYLTKNNSKGKTDKDSQYIKNFVEHGSYGEEKKEQKKEDTIDKSNINTIKNKKKSLTPTNNTGAVAKISSNKKKNSPSLSSLKEKTGSNNTAPNTSTSKTGSPSPKTTTTRKKSNTPTPKAKATPSGAKKSFFKFENDSSVFGPLKDYELVELGAQDIKLLKEFARSNNITASNCKKIIKDYDTHQELKVRFQEKLADIKNLISECILKFIELKKSNNSQKDVTIVSHGGPHSKDDTTAIPDNVKSETETAIDIEDTKYPILIETLELLLSKLQNLTQYNNKSSTGDNSTNLHDLLLWEFKYVFLEDAEFHYTYSQLLDLLKPLLLKNGMSDQLTAIYKKIYD